MTDKVQKIREEVERMHNLLPIMDGDNISLNYADRICTTLEMYIDSLQEEQSLSNKQSVDKAMEEIERKAKLFTEANKGKTSEEILAEMRGEEPVSERFAFKAIPRLLEMIEPTDRAKAYTAKLADTLEVEGYSTDAKIVRESLKIMNGEKVAMATMDEEPVSEELGEASKEWLRPQLDKSYANYGEGKMMELTRFDGYAMLDAIEFGAKWQQAKDESTTEDLGEYINELSKQFPGVSFAKLSRIAVRVAKWQKEQIKKAMDLGEPPYLISVEQAYYRTLKLLEE